MTTKQAQEAVRQLNVMHFNCDNEEIQELIGSLTLEIENEYLSTPEIVETPITDEEKDFYQTKQNFNVED